MSAIPDRIRRLVDDRDQQTDRLTGHYLGAARNIHHRLLRSQGGDHRPSGLITVSGSGTTGSHGWLHSHPAAARKLGYIVPSWVKDPSLIPVYVVTATGWQRWVRFDDKGGVWPQEDDTVDAVMRAHGIWHEGEHAPHVHGPVTPVGGRLPARRG